MLKPTALITGASRGIGRAAALALAAGGYDLAICCSSNIEALSNVKKEAKALGARCLALQADVADSAACAHIFQEIEKSLGSVDVLINNAGISRIGLLQDLSFEDWNRLIAVNLSGVFYCCKLAIPGMVRKKQGKIINISSVWGVCGASCEAAYSASKAGLNGLTKALAKELAPSNIQVNALACGVIDTAMNARLSPEEARDLTDEIPAGRFGTPEETARLVLMLADAPSYMTGQIIGIDGGFL